MRINSTIISSTKATRTDRAVSKSSSFTSKIGSQNAPKGKLSTDAPISHEELMAMASDFKNGLINKEEANARFVSAVVDQSLRGKLSDKGREAVARDIANTCADDPEHMSSLQKNLRNLG